MPLVSGYVQLRLASPAIKYVESGWGTWSDEECRVRMYMWAVDLYCWAGMLLSFWLTFDNVYLCIGGRRVGFDTTDLWFCVWDIWISVCSQFGWYLGYCKDVVVMVILGFYSVVRVYPQWGKLLAVSCVNSEMHVMVCVLWFDRFGLNVPLIFLLLESVNIWRMSCFTLFLIL